MKALKMIVDAAKQYFNFATNGGKVNAKIVAAILIDWIVCISVVVAFGLSPYWLLLIVAFNVVKVIKQRRNVIRFNFTLDIK